MKISYFQEIFPTGSTAGISLEKISFSLLRPYLQKPYANLSETNVVSPQTGLMCVLMASLKQFSLLSDLLVIRMHLNFRAGDYKKSRMCRLILGDSFSYAYVAGVLACLSVCLCLCFCHSENQLF